MRPQDSPRMTDLATGAIMRVRLQHYTLNRHYQPDEARCISALECLLGTVQEEKDNTKADLGGQPGDQLCENAMEALSEPPI